MSDWIVYNLFVDCECVSGFCLCDVSFRAYMDPIISYHCPREIQNPKAD